MSPAEGLHKIAFTHPARLILIADVSPAARGSRYIWHEWEVFVRLGTIPLEERGRKVAWHRSEAARRTTMVERLWLLVVLSGAGEWGGKGKLQFGGGVVKFGKSGKSSPQRGGHRLRIYLVGRPHSGLPRA